MNGSRFLSSRILAWKHRRWLLASLGMLLWLLPAPAQQPPQAPQYPNPRLVTVTPPGGKVGTTVEVTVAGTDLDEAAGLYFSQAGIKSERADATKFKVTIPAETPVGAYDVRVVGKWGISNPRTFVVGDLNEALEKEPNNDVPDAQLIELNSTASGVISANTDVDYYKFEGKKGQRVVIHCAASSIDSRLTPFVQLFDAANRQFGSSQRYQDRDAVLDSVLPADGSYHVRVCEFAYLAANAEYFYRLSVSLAPWIDVAYPPVVEAGKSTSITLYGRNLPNGQPDPNATVDNKVVDRLAVDIKPPADPMSGQRLSYAGALLPRSGGVDGFEYRVKNAAGTSNPVLLTYATAPVILDNEDNDSPDKPQELTLPCELCGRIEQMRDRDWYAFTAKQNEVYVLEGFADRLNAPIDLYFELLRADQQSISEFDDHTEVPATVGRFFLGTDDPKTRFVVPADGRYLLRVSTRTADFKAGPRRIYRLSIRPEQPDFRMVLIGNHEFSGAGCTLRQGSNQNLQVICIRRDGFNGEVTLTAEGLPTGVTCSPQVLAANQRDTYLVLNAAPDAPPWAGALKIKGTATINGTAVVREARAGTVVWQTAQPQIPAISRLAQTVCLAVREPGPFSLEIANREMMVPLGGTAVIGIKLNRTSPDFRAQVVVSRLAGPLQPNGQPLAIPNVTIAAGRNEGELRFQVPNNTPAGTYNLVLLGTAAPFQFSKDPTKPKANITMAEVAPAVKITVYSSVLDVAVASANVPLPPGGTSELGVKVNRLQGFKGPVTLQLVLPQGTQGVSAPSVTLAADASDAKLVITSAEGMKPGPIANVIVRATAMMDKQAITQDARITVTISKDSNQFKTVAFVPAGADGWKYFPAKQVQGDGWRAAGFDDKGWRTARAPLGYGEEEIGARKGTTVTDQGQSLYFRKTFDVPADLLAQKDGIVLRLAVASDDSAVVYINGEKVEEDPEADHEYKYWNRELDIPAKALKAGTNVIAVLVKNKDGSSDLFFDLELIADVPVPAAKK